MERVAARRFSETTAERIDEAVRAIIDGAFRRASAILAENRALLDTCAEQLLARETLDEAALGRLTAGLKPAGRQQADSERQLAPERSAATG
jgi:cell division protease FtsH